MATLPLTRQARALTVGLALSGVMLVCPPLPAHPIAAAAASNGIWAFEDPAPPPPPPDTRVPADPAAPQGVPPPHRRHIDGDPNIER